MQPSSIIDINCIISTTAKSDPISVQYSPAVVKDQEPATKDQKTIRNFQYVGVWTSSLHKSAQKGELMAKIQKIGVLHVMP